MNWRCFMTVDTTNIKVNMEVKSYKIMCDLLSESVKNSNAKKAQLLEWERYFRWEKIKNKFIIKEIYSTPKEKTVTRGGSRNVAEYLPNIEKLLFDLLASKKYNGELCLPKMLLLTLLKMVNDNYKYGKYETFKLSAFLNIDENELQEFYERSKQMLESNIEATLKKLDKQSWIRWKMVRMICYGEATINVNNNGEIKVDTVYETNEYGERVMKSISKNNTSQYIIEASSDEDEYIRSVERNVMNNMGFKDKQQLIRHGKYHIYSARVGDTIKEERNILYYFECYKIRSSIEHVQLKLHYLNQEEREQEQISLNAGIIKRIQKNTSNRHEKAVVELQNNIEGKNNIRRSQDEYIEIHNQLINTLINIDFPSIVWDIRAANKIN